MRKLERIGGVFLLVAALLIGFALFRTGGDFSKLDNTSFAIKEETFSSQAIKELKLDVSSANIEITGTNHTDKIMIKYPESKNSGFSFKKEGNKLTVSEEHKGFFSIFSFDLSIFSNKNRKLEISLPQDALDELSLEGSSGDIDIQQLEIKNDINIEISSGYIQISNTNIGGNLSVDLTSGEAVLSTIQTNHLNLYATSGNLQMNDLTVLKESSIELTSGDLELTRFNPGHQTTISSTSGNISGALLGKMTDYTIESSVTSGSSNLPPHLDGGSKELRVEATSGDINISFSDK